MIEAVGTLSVSGSSLRAIPQSRSTYAQAAPASSAPRFTNSRIRFDNFLNMAILEMRASDTGEVTTQYPTESQIRAIQRASELNQRREKLVSDPVDRQVQADTPEQSYTSLPSSGDSSFSNNAPTLFSSGQGSSYTASVPLSVPSPSVSTSSSAPAPTGDASSGSSSGAGYTTQSIVV